MHSVHSHCMHLAASLCASTGEYTPLSATRRDGVTADRSVYSVLVTGPSPPRALSGAMPWASRSALTPARRAS